MGHGDSEVAPENLDDERDRAKLRDRYYGLLQELRVVLPSVQVLVAFLLTVPFGQRFGERSTTSTAACTARRCCSRSSRRSRSSADCDAPVREQNGTRKHLRVSILMTRIGTLPRRRDRPGAPHRVPLPLRHRDHRVARRCHRRRDGDVLDHRAAPAPRRRRGLSVSVPILARWLIGGPRWARRGERLIHGGIVKIAVKP